MSPSTLKTLDAAYLPWSVETFEEQLLLSSVCESRYVGKGDSPGSAKFVIWSSNPDYGAGSDSEEDDADEIEAAISDHEPDDEDDVATLRVAEMDLQRAAKRRTENEDEKEHPELDFPGLPSGTRFHWLCFHRHLHFDGESTARFR